MYYHHPYADLVMEVFEAYIKQKQGNEKIFEDLLKSLRKKKGFSQIHFDAYLGYILSSPKAVDLADPAVVKSYAMLPKFWLLDMYSLVGSVGKKPSGKKI
ncbi:MAG: hypothetical protein COV43_08020 [Deltaproteobacteria bacterium CG11_big_fil_rev_8_21_14_0_20_42_23]|nr:MAG: hypothetical protein COV43_08020 [Deltaproteobacteria bacterium CG11_big_fil_rev_8_21_14_0_20_42_23]PJC64158.1 MAG: hypothetical protein CO021_05795 [Deltaproteobacteria bacterium CG_4_9_14_0_2_um_filter_42_21]